MHAKEQQSTIYLFFYIIVGHSVQIDTIYYMVIGMKNLKTLLFHPSTWMGLKLSLRFYIVSFLYSERASFIMTTRKAYSKYSKKYHLIISSWKTYFTNRLWFLCLFDWHISYQTLPKYDLNAIFSSKNINVFCWWAIILNIKIIYARSVQRFVFLVCG